MEQIPPPPWRAAKRKSGKPQLSQDVIVDTALKILDAEGMAAVSMRRVADELNTGAASLYAHISNKEELLELVYEKVSGEIPVPVPDPDLWVEQLRQLCRDSFRVLSSHNDIALVSMANLPTGVNTLKLGEAMLGIILAGGVPPQQAAWAVDRIWLYLIADAYEGSLYVLKQKGSGLDMQAWQAEYFGRLASYYRTLPPEVFPSFTANLDTMMTGDGDERFEFGLELLIRGLLSYVPKDKSKGGKRSRP